MEWAGRPDIEKVQIGDKVKVPMGFLKDNPTVKATVTYVNPRKRFFQVEFDGTKIKESFCAYGDLS